MYGGGRKSWRIEKEKVKGRRWKEDGEKHLTLPGWLPHSRCCASKPHRATCVNKRNGTVLVPRLCAPPVPSTLSLSRPSTNLTLLPCPVLVRLARDARPPELFALLWVPRMRYVTGRANETRVCGVTPRTCVHREAWVGGLARSRASNVLTLAIAQLLIYLQFREGGTGLIRVPSNDEIQYRGPAVSLHGLRTGEP